MKVAPSFEKFVQITEPFIKGAKYYVTVENPETGNRRDVRAYTDTEYAKAYGKKLVDADKGYDGLKQARGFSIGPILVIRGNRPDDEAWLNDSCARYAVGLGWHFVSTDTLPDDIPAHFKCILLGWEEFKNGDDRHMKAPAVLADLILEKVRNNKDIIKF